MINRPPKTMFRHLFFSHNPEHPHPIPLPPATHFQQLISLPSTLLSSAPLSLSLSPAPNLQNHHRVPAILIHRQHPTYPIPSHHPKTPFSLPLHNRTPCTLLTDLATSPTLPTCLFGYHAFPPSSSYSRLHQKPHAGNFLQPPKSPPILGLTST